MRSRHNNRTTTLAIIFGGCVVVSLFVFSAPLKSAMRSLGLPVMHTANAISGNTSIGSWVHTKKQLMQEVEDLKTAQIELAVLQGEHAALVARNTELARAARFIENSGTSYITVRVYGEGASPYGTLLVSAGRSEGVVVHAPVLLSDNVLFGVVEEVSEHTAVIRAISASGIERSVQIGSSTGLVYTGRGGSGLVEAPRSVPVSIGDYVFDTEHHHSIGRVGYIDVSPEDAAQRIHIAPIATPLSVRSALIPIATP